MTGFATSVLGNSIVLDMSHIYHILHSLDPSKFVFWALFRLSIQMGMGLDFHALGLIVLCLPQGLVAPPVQGFAFPVRKMVEVALGGSMLRACDSSDLLHMQGHWYVGTYLG